MSAATTAAANTELIKSFYEAFQKRDANAMGACYAPGITFRDPCLAGWKANELGRCGVC